MIKIFLIVISLFVFQSSMSQAHNPVIFADVPDLSMIRVGDTYYVSSTTMHMSPGVPIMQAGTQILISFE